ncbi:MAG: fructose-6-phosphate aldolase [Clostridia bacterium]|nr:fructose-6-phosphate aldolase [Clostridia bacterium]
MIYLLDTADVESIKRCNEFYPIEGVTTNPSIIAKEKKDFWELVEEIRNIIGNDKMFHIQTRAEKAEDIIKEAMLLIGRLGGEIYIKIPICEEGLKATMQLNQMGIKVTMTAIFTPAQALLAARAGASFVAPYVNRLDNILGDGVDVVAQIVEEFKKHDIQTKVLAASFKNAEQVHKCALAGCHSATITEGTLKNLVSYPMTDSAIKGFDKDWKKVYGDKIILDL